MEKGHSIECHLCHMLSYCKCVSLYIFLCLYLCVKSFLNLASLLDSLCLKISIPLSSDLLLAYLICLLLAFNFAWAFIWIHPWHCPVHFISFGSTAISLLDSRAPSHLHPVLIVAFLIFPASTSVYFNFPSFLCCYSYHLFIVSSSPFVLESLVHILRPLSSTIAHLPSIFFLCTSHHFLISGTPLLLKSSPLSFTSFCPLFQVCFSLTFLAALSSHALLHGSTHMD